MSCAQVAMKKLEKKNREKKLPQVINNDCPLRFVALMLHSYRMVRFSLFYLAKLKKVVSVSLKIPKLQ